MNPDHPVPLLDLTRYDEELKRAIACGVEGVFSSGRFILGAVNTQFEKAFADRIGVRHALGVSSGTDALLVALMALGVGPGDEVITSPFSFFASAGVVSRLGGRPVFVDIEPDTFNVNADRLSAAITPRTKVIMPVHLYGQCADMDTIQEISGEIPIVEDACQAVGATQQRRTAGAMGKMGAFSFYPTKNLGGAGDAGAVTTDDDDLAALVSNLRLHGESERYHHLRVGGNFRMDSVQAATPGLPGGSRSPTVTGSCCGTPRCPVGSLSRRSRPGGGTSSTSTWSACRIAIASARSSPKPESPRRSSIPFRFTCRSASRTWAIARATFRRPRGRRKRSSRCRSFRS